jgi:hypothetical protein
MFPAQVVFTTVAVYVVVVAGQTVSGLALPRFPEGPDHVSVYCGMPVGEKRLPSLLVLQTDG